MYNLTPPAKIPLATLRWASANGKYPRDILQHLEDSLRLFHEDAGLYDTADLRGPVKRAELIIKLGYWLALGQLTTAEFRDWIGQLPPEDNLGWDVDLYPPRPGSVMPRVLKMGLQAPARPAGLCQNA
jgi:hypothetical protein